MPTTSLGIEFPCETDVIDPSDFAEYALSVESALSTTFAQAAPLLRRDYVAAFASTSAAVGATTTLSWTTPSAINNPNGMFSAGSPTLFTLSASGSYLVTLRVSLSGGPTTGTSYRAAVLLAGAEQIWAKLPGDGTNTLPLFQISGHLISATAGQQVTATVLWTGTGGPITAQCLISICKISDL